MIIGFVISNIISMVLVIIAFEMVKEGK